jgi:hypothetical protein
MAGKAKKRSVSEAVAAFAAEVGMDQVVMVGYNSQTERYVMVAHGRNILEQQDADCFAERLLNGLGAPKDRIDHYGKKANKG